MSLAPFVKILGRGPGRARALTQDEAREAMLIILQGDAAPEAIGALLMLLRMKGETAPELAGFVQAARASIPWTAPTPALDWPSYAAGRTRGLPWFLLSARLVAAAGFPTVLHGWNAHQQGHADVRQGLDILGIPQANSQTTAQTQLAQTGLTYIPLESLSRPLFDLLALRDTLGLRSCINTVLRLLNPARARASVQGVFHPVYRTIQSDVCARLHLPALSVIKGGGGEFERHPGKDTLAFGLRAGTPWQQQIPAQPMPAQRLGDITATPEHLARLWDGTWHDPFAEAVVLGTASLALHTLGVAEPDAQARHLWTHRQTARAA